MEMSFRTPEFEAGPGCATSLKQNTCVTQLRLHKAPYFQRNCWNHLAQTVHLEKQTTRTDNAVVKKKNTTPQPCALFASHWISQVIVHSRPTETFWLLDLHTSKFNTEKNQLKSIPATARWLNISLNHKTIFHFQL